jgi:DNA-binding beta-propeller fold protein YncE
VFNGDAGSLDRVDFHVPHQIGGEDHADGEVHRYVVGQLRREPEVPSHLAYDVERGLVYAADTGHGRIVSVDPSTATAGGEIDVWEQLQASGMMNDATLRELVPPGALQKPSGLSFAGGKLYVTDNATSLVHVFDTDGRALASYDTGLPTGSLAGITLGPDGLIYLSDLKTGAVQRFEQP